MPTPLGTAAINVVLNDDQAIVPLSIPATGINRCLAVAVYTWNGSSGPTISSVTFNGVAMTAGPSAGTLTGTGIIQWFYLQNPPTGGPFDLIATTTAVCEELTIGGQGFSEVPQSGSPFGTLEDDATTFVNSSSGTVSLGTNEIALAFLSAYDPATLDATPNGTGVEEDGVAGTIAGFQYRANATLGWSFNILADAAFQTSVPLKHSASSAAQLEAAAADVASASAALTTQIRAAAAASDNASSTGALTTAIRLAAAAVSAASASGVFSGGAQLAAAATDVATAVGALTTGVSLNGVALDTAIATGALTNWATITLSGTLYTGQGGVLDPNFWLDSVPTVGTTLYYDSTNITIYTNGEISSNSNNCAALVQFFDGVSWAQGLVVITQGLAAVAKSSASASAQLGTAIRLAAAASALATASAAFSTGAGLTAAASDSASVTASISTQIPLSALATNVTTAVAALTTQIRLQAGAAGTATSSADLNGVIAMTGAAMALSTLSANLATAIRVAGVATDSAAASGSLTTGVTVSASAQDIVTASAALATLIALGGSASDTVNATADLTTARNLVAAAVDVATAIAAMSTGIRLDAHSNVISQASADLKGSIALLAQAGAEAASSAELTDIITNPPIGAYASDPRFVAAKQRWSFFSSQRTDRFDVKDPAEGVVLTFDLSVALSSDEYLSGPITLTIAASSGSDVSPRTLLVGVPSYDMTKRKILQPVKGGIDGNTYYVKVSAKTNVANRVVALAGLLPVRG